jgi:hypothetical protein
MGPQAEIAAMSKIVDGWLIVGVSIVHDTLKYATAAYNRWVDNPTRLDISLLVNNLPPQDIGRVLRICEAEGNKRRVVRVFKYATKGHRYMLVVVFGPKHDTVWDDKLLVEVMDEKKSEAFIWSAALEMAKQYEASVVADRFGIPMRTLAAKKAYATVLARKAQYDTLYQDVSDAANVLSLGG